MGLKEIGRSPFRCFCWHAAKPQNESLGFSPSNGNVIEIDRCQGCPGHDHPERDALNKGANTNLLESLPGKACSDQKQRRRQASFSEMTQRSILHGKPRHIGGGGGRETEQKNKP